MKMFKLLLLVFIQVQVQGNKYVITRKARDIFILPSFLCTSNWGQQCTIMGGKKTGANCTCQCTEDPKNVFAYLDNSWNCTSNKDIREKYSGEFIIIIFKLINNS